MAIFAIQQVNASGSEGTLKGSIETMFPSDHYEVQPAFWLISADTTAQALSGKLGITAGERGSGLVIEFASYFGRADPAIWSWIKTKWEGGKVG